MNTYSKQQLRQLVIARRRPLCLYLGNLDTHLHQQLCDYYIQSSNNTLQQAINQRQQRSIPIDQKQHLHRHYRQLQIHPAAHTTLPNCSLSITNRLTESLGPLDRIRISSLAPGKSLPLHLDDPQQNRAIALLAGRQRLTINDKSSHLEIHMKEGEIWFINTAWPHEIHNPGTKPRLALLLDLLKTPMN